MSLTSKRQNENYADSVFSFGNIVWLARVASLRTVHNHFWRDLSEVYFRTSQK